MRSLWGICEVLVRSLWGLVRSLWDLCEDVVRSLWSRCVICVVISVRDIFEAAWGLRAVCAQFLVSSDLCGVFAQFFWGVCKVFVRSVRRLFELFVSYLLGLCVRCLWREDMRSLRGRVVPTWDGNAGFTRLSNGVVGVVISDLTVVHTRVISLAKVRSKKSESWVKDYAQFWGYA